MVGVVLQRLSAAAAESMLLRRCASSSKQSYCCSSFYRMTMAAAVTASSSSSSSSFSSRRNLSTSTKFRPDVIDDDGDDDDFYDGGFNSNKDEPWKTLLTEPARAAWRVASPRPPEAFQQSLKRVLDDGGRTNKQLHYTHKNVIMPSHRALALRRERERKRAIMNKEYDKSEMKRDAEVTPVLYGPEETLASFQFRLYPNYEVVKRILREAKNLVPSDSNNWKPRRIIDFGIGCGSSSVAALDVWRESVEWVHGIDPSQTMREGAKAFLEKYIENRRNSGVLEKVGGDDDESRRDRFLPTTNAPRVTLSAHLSSSSSSSSSSDEETAASVASPASFDLALFAYTATELPDAVSTLAAAAMLWEKLLPNGLLVVVEPGTPDGFSTVRTIRNMLLSSCPPSPNNDYMDEGEGEDEVVEECHVIAPCTHNGKCPIERFQHLTSQGRRRSKAVEEEEEGDGDDEEEEEEDDDEDFSDDDHSDGPEPRRKRYCSFVHTMSTFGSGSRRSFGGKKVEKFSYVVLQKRVRGRKGQHAEASSTSQLQTDERFDSFDAGVVLTDLLRRSKKRAQMDDQVNGISAIKDLEARYLDSCNDDDDELGLDFLLRGDSNRSSFGRILHAPKKRRGHVLIDCCTTRAGSADAAADSDGDGQIVRLKITKSMSSADKAPGLYAAARKSRWGGFWPCKI